MEDAGGRFSESTRSRLAAWMSAHGVAVTPPLFVEAISGGRSNITYRVADAGGRSWVLRRPPFKAALPLAHDMGREHRILAALQATTVPTPPVFGHCPDEEVVGASFLLMGFVEGITLRAAADAEALSEGSRRTLSAEFAGALASLHRLEPAEVGLKVLGRGSDYVSRQLRMWKMQLASYAGRALPVLDQVAERLGAAIPPQQAESVTHGDYRLDNVLAAPDGAVRAVVDWELCTLGDPLADLGLALACWTEPADGLVPFGEAATLAPGFATREELAALYAERTGFDLRHLDYYLALGCWKFAAIMEGVYQRYLTGAYDDDESWRRFEWVVPALADKAAAYADAAGC